MERANRTLPDRLAAIPELAAYECFAADGHWHQAAAHDPRHDGAKPRGPFLQSKLAHANPAASGRRRRRARTRHERAQTAGLRQDAPKGRRVLLIYDKAGIDFDCWRRCRHECAVCFLSRAKEDQVLEWMESTAWNRTDRRNHGAVEDMRVKTRTGHPLRLICYLDPARGQAFEFLTNEPDLPPGVLAELYRRRWDIEKVFDALNKLGETKAWATSLGSRATQAQFLRLTHNLLLLYEQVLGAAPRRRQPRRRPAPAATPQANGGGRPPKLGRLSPPGDGSCGRPPVSA